MTVENLDRIEINIVENSTVKKRKVLMLTWLGQLREIEVDDQGNNEELQLHVNLENLKATEKMLETIKERWI